MALLTVLAIAVGLAMDAFAVAIAVGSRLERLSFRPLFRLSFHFGLFQFLMPIIGWFIGSKIASRMHRYDHWIAFAILAAVGVKMIYESTTKTREQLNAADPTRKWSLMALSLATSLDAWAIGLTVAMLNIEILYPSTIIGVTALVMTVIGMYFGRKLGERFGRKMEFLGGALLIVIGIKIVLEHL